MRGVLRKGTLVTLRDFSTVARIAGGVPSLALLSFFFSSVSAVLEALVFGLISPLVQTLLHPGGHSEKFSITLFRLFSFPLPVSADGQAGTMTHLVLALLILSLGKAILDLIASLVIVRRVQDFVARLRVILFGRMLTFGKAYFDNAEAGTVHNLIISYSASLSTGLLQIRGTLTTLFYAGVYCFILFHLSWQLTLAASLVGPLYYGLARLSFQKLKLDSEAQVSMTNRMSQLVLSVLFAMPLVTSYRTQEQEKKRFGKMCAEAARLELEMARKQSFVQVQQDALLTLLMLGLVLLAYRITANDTGAAAVSDYLVFFLVLRRLSGSINSLTQTRMILERIGGNVRPILAIFEDSEKYQVTSGTSHHPGLSHTIEFRDLSFTYPKGNIALRKVSFSAKKGELTAIVGPSGSGKTTIFHLLQRSYDCPPGTIFLDGKDIRSLDLDGYHEKIAIVSQDLHIFRESVRYNLCYGLRRKVSDEELRHVLEKCALTELVDKLSLGIDTVLGDRGAKLSGGEKQRLSIARAMLKGSEVLLLDEATSALDTHTERLIQKAIDPLLKGRTALVIAHRLSTILHADNVIVLDHGEVVERGTVKALLKKKGRFYSFHRQQVMAHAKENLRKAS